MNYQDITASAKHAVDTGDFSRIEEVSLRILGAAQKRWAPHEAQDRRCENYDRKPWWKRIFLRIFLLKPFDGALPGRVGAWENLNSAEGLRYDVEQRDVRALTNR